MAASGGRKFGRILVWGAEVCSKVERWVSFWILGRQSGCVRGIYNRVVADSHFLVEEVPPEVQCRRNAAIFGGWVLGSDPVDLVRKGDKNKHMLSVQDTSLSGQFAGQWKSRTEGSRTEGSRTEGSGQKRTAPFIGVKKAL